MNRVYSDLSSFLKFHNLVLDAQQIVNIVVPVQQAGFFIVVDFEMFFLLRLHSMVTSCFSRLISSLVCGSVCNGFETQQPGIHRIT